MFRGLDGDLAVDWRGAGHRPGGYAAGAVEEPDREPGDSHGQDGQPEVQHCLGHEGSQRDRYGADGVQDERRRGDLAGAEHGGDEGQGAEEEQDGYRGQCDAQRAGSECRTVSAGRSLKTRLMTNSTPTSADRANAFSRKATSPKMPVGDRRRGRGR